ncbi:hypothetical protein C030_01745 [Brucella abortus 85/69]|nr:hypothetical protein C030_01745 [Brucella abortus 85/69]
MQRVIASIASRLVIAVPYLWLLVFFLVPFFIVFKISLSEVAMAIPAYAPTFDLARGFAANWEKIKQLSFDNYLWLLDDPLYYKAYLSSVRIAAISTVLTLIVAYPMAYGIARAPATIRPTLLMMVILPFWTSFLIRVYAWIGILKPEGLLNQFLMGLNIIDTPLNILNTDTAVFIGIVYSYLPFMVLPIYSSLEKMDYSLIEAAQDLRCTPFAAFWKITFRCRWRVFWPAASSSSSRRWANSSSRIFWVDHRR